VTSGNLHDRLNGYIKPAAFSIAPQFTFGNVARILEMRGPGLAQWDMSLFKNIPIHERLSAQFRFEALNAFNTPYFGGPNNAFGTAAFGRITSQVNIARQLQLALKLIW